MLAYGAGIILAIMLVLYFASRGGMGEGDVKLASGVGYLARFSSREYCVCCLPLSAVALWEHYCCCAGVGS